MRRSGSHPGNPAAHAAKPGDARPGGLAYLWVDDVDAVAAEFGSVVEDNPWARDVEITDPDGNRIRVGTSTRSAESD